MVKNTMLDTEEIELKPISELKEGNEVESADLPASCCQYRLLTQMAGVLDASPQHFLVVIAFLFNLPYFYSDMRFPCLLMMCKGTDRLI